MKALLYLFPILGCAGMMLICMLLMGGHRLFKRGSEPETASAADVEALRAEVARLRADQTEPTDREVAGG